MRGALLFALGLSLAAVSCSREVAPARHLPHADVPLRLDTETIEARVPPHATLDSLLRQHQFPTELVASAVASAQSVFNLRQLRADRPYRLVRSLDGFLREFEYQIDADRFLRIFSRDREQPAVLEAEVVAYEKRTTVTAIRAEIDRTHPSVIAATEAAGERVQLALALADIFGGQIDFDSEMQPGDGFEALFEKSSHDGQFSGYGAVLSARFRADGRDHQAYRWVNPETGKAGYYDVNGRSLKRLILRSPLQFQPRVTSGFSRNRLHPVFRTYRAHLGVDYAAPIGSPVIAVASGVVVSAGWSGGGGNMIRLRHGQGLDSYYLHLSSIGNGIRPGVHVNQGEVIGRVGATGTATGPHLDYRLSRNGVFLNPLTEQRKQPPGDPIPDGMIPAFRRERDAMVQRLSTTLLADAAPPKPDAVTAADARPER